MRNIKLICKFLLAVLLVFTTGQPLLAFAQTTPSQMTLTEIGSSATNPIKVLKIIPGEHANARVGIEKKTSGSMYLLVETITMPEFIGETTKLNGYYDVIQIDNQYNTGFLNNGTIRGQRAYSAIVDSGEECKSPSDNNVCKIHNTTQLIDSTTNSGIKRTANYTENDITNRKSQEIITFAKSGQLVFFDQSIASSDNLKQAKLNTILASGLSGLPTYQKYQTSLTLEKIVEQYKNLITKKRMSFTITQQPAATGTTADSRNLRYSIQIPGQNKKAKLKLYLDMNGDGVFQEKELYEQIDVISNSTEQTINLESKIPTEFIGILDWKIEIECNDVKNYQTGSIIFEYLEGMPKKVIKVLQIMPGNSTDTDYNLTKIQKFQNLLDEVKGYDISITVKNATSLTVQEDFQQYDMLIFGFKDGYGGGNGSPSSEVVAKIIDYAKTEKSIMFTHDTFSASYSAGPAILAQNFRSALGQARFYDFVRAAKGTENNKNANIDLQGNEIKYDVQAKANKLYGLNIYSGNDYKPNSDDYRQSATKVYQTNSAQITDYPYQLEGEITVANTHTQYFQLNLEDEDVVPWYNLQNDVAANKYDSRNSYYTYSKGSLTFSGTGHSSAKNVESELKLFVNTIVKAERGANHAPVISTDLVNNTEIAAPAGNDLTFNVSAIDIDNDQVQLEVKLDNQLIQAIPLQKSGTNNQITLSKTLLQTVGTKEVTITAVDERGAVAQPVTRSLKLVNTPVVEANATAQQGLLGDLLKVPVKLELKNTSSTQVISEVSVAFPTTSTALWEVKNPTQPVVLENNQAQLTYEVQPKAEFTNTLIAAQVNYKVNGVAKQATINLSIAAKQGKFDVRVVDINGNPLTTTDTAVALNGEQTNIYINRGSRVDITSFSGTPLATTDYTAEFIEPSTFNLELQETCVQTSATTPCQTSAIDMALSYQQPYYRVTYKVDQILLATSPIRVLEIQPADSFQVSKLGGWIRTGQEEIGLNGEITTDDTEFLELVQKQANPTNRPVIIKHMTMAEFIASTEKINGQYDVVILGNSNGSEHFTVQNAASDQLAYATYSKQESQKVSNDITQRRLDEIKAYVASGQLFYIDQGLQQNGVAGTIIDGVKGLTGSNVKQEIPTVEQLLQTYHELPGQYKAAEISKIDPATDTYETALGDPVNRTMRFIMSASDPSLQQEDVQLKLTLDIDGDGLFKDDEVVITQDATLPLTNHTLTYEMPNDFVGLLDWKIELIKKGVDEPIKSADFGQTLFRRLGEKKKVRVLQVIPYDDVTDSIQHSLNLKTNPKWNELLATVPDYEFTFTPLALQAFNDDTKRPVLNGNFDMVILGFANAFNGKDLTATSAKALKEFVDTGQGLMLTHDTLYSASAQISSVFGPISGQLANQQSLPGEWTINQSKRVYEQNEALITNYPFDLSVNVDQNNLIPVRRTHQQWRQLNLEDENVIPWYTMTPNTVTTSGSIEDYPNQPQTGADYTDNTANTNNPNQPADTSTINRYDARNNYYTYSYNNITFSGTGENWVEPNTQYPLSEMQLFVNTIVRAERAMNHAPTFTTSNIPTEIGFMQSNNDKAPQLNFSVIPRDIDRDLMTIQVSLKNGTKEIGTGIKEKTGINDQQLTNFELEIAKQDIKINDQLQLTITVTDEHGAKAEKTFKITVVEKVLLDIQLKSAGGYLVGDTAEITSETSSQGGPGNSEDFKAIKTTMTYQQPFLQLVSGQTDYGPTGAMKPNDFATDLEPHLKFSFQIRKEETIKFSEPIYTNINMTYNYQSRSQNNVWHDLKGETTTLIGLKRSRAELRVVTEEGTPVKNVPITLGNQTYQTDQSGKVTVTDLVTGTHQVTLTLTDYDIVKRELQYRQANDSLSVKENLPDQGFGVSYEKNQPVVTYTVKLKNPLLGQIEIGLENNQFEIGTATPTLVGGSIAKIGAKFQLTGQPSQIIVESPSAVTPPELYYKTTLGYSKAPGVVIWSYDQTQKRWIGSIKTTQWQAGQPLIQWSPPTIGNPREFIVRWSVQVGSTTTPTKIQIVPGPAETNLKAMDIKVYNNPENTGTNTLPDLF